MNYTHVMIEKIMFISLIKYANFTDKLVCVSFESVIWA